MADTIKQMEDKFIADKKKAREKAGFTLEHQVELGMRIAYNEGATVFRALGQHEGDKSRKKKMIDALGLVEEEKEN